MQQSTHYRWVGSNLVLQLRVAPRASRNQIGELIGDRLKLFITAPPVDGKANRHLIKFLAKQFGVSSGQIQLLCGHSSRDKTFQVTEPARLPVAFFIATE